VAQIEKVDKVKAVRKEKQQKRKKRNDLLAKVDLIFDKNAIDAPKGQKLVDQIAAFALASALLLKAKEINKAAEKRKAIKDAIDKFKSGVWSLKTTQKVDSNTEEEEEEDSDNLFQYIFSKIFFVIRIFKKRMKFSVI
jgi:hypothetical protein